MLRLVTFATFATCYLSAALATPNFKFATTAMAEDIPFRLSYSDADLNYGKDIDLFFSEISKNTLKKKTLDYLKSNIQKAHSFSILNPILARLELIMKINDQDSFYKDCSITSKNVNEFTNNLAERINITVDKYCRNLFLKKLTALSPGINFSSRDLAYFKDAIPFFTSGENQSELVLFLQHYKGNSIEHEKLSNLLIEKHIELRTKPSPAVLANLKINSTFNRFLQNNLNLVDTSNSYFQEEFYRLSRDAQDAAEKNDPVKAKLIITNAINFYSNNKHFIDAHKAWIGVILTGKALFYKGKDAEAIEIFHLAKSISPKEDFSETFFYLIWPHIINKDYKAIKSAVDKNSLEKNFDQYDSKLQYWIAYAILKTGDVKKATTLFDKIITTSPYSFYSIISLKELAALKKETTPEAEILSRLVSSYNPSDFSLSKTSYLLQDSLRRLAIWNKIRNERFATLELRYIQSLSKDDTFASVEFGKKITPQMHKEFLLINLIRLLNSQKRFIASFKLFQDSLEKNSFSLNYKLMKFIFPLNYFDLIKKNAQNIDPLIIISLIRQESAFNPDAKSGAGAQGLMQLMPATAKRFNRRIKASHLGDPEINVAIGTKYLRLLISRFDGNLIFALASYNAGENRIDNWRRDIFRNDDPLAIIESIPYEETRNYVKLIYRNNFFYSLLSNQSVLMVPLEETFKVSLRSKH